MKTALLLIDIQNDYFPDGKMELEVCEAAAANAAALLSLFRERQLPIVHVQHIAVHANASFFLPDTEGVQIHRSVAPLQGETVIQKHFPNSFRQTPLLEHLKQHEITHLVVAGMMTHMCIDSTLRAANDLGFVCQLAHDACATKALSFGAVSVPAAQVHGAFVSALHGSFAEALSTRDLISRFSAPLSSPQ